MKILLYPLLIVLANIFIVLGNLQFGSSNFEESFEYFKTAAGFDVDQNGTSNYNAANSLYRLNDFEKAKDYYLEALKNAEVSGNKNSEALILYNLGNTSFRIGQSFLETDPKRTIEEWILAIEYYEKSLEINPDDQDAKENIEYIKKLLEELQQQQEQQQEQEQEKEEELNEDQKEEVERIEEEEKESRSNRNDNREEEESGGSFGEPSW